MLGGKKYSSRWHLWSFVILGKGIEKKRTRSKKGEKMIATIALLTNTVMAIDKGKRSHYQTRWGRIGETRLYYFPVSLYLLTVFFKYSLVH